MNWVLNSKPNHPGVLHYLIHVAWIRRFIRFHRYRHPADMGGEEVESFLTHLALNRRVPASTLDHLPNAGYVVSRDPGWQFILHGS